MITDKEETYESKLIWAVMGECENCSPEEKFLIACVGWNRWRHKEWFENIEKDFYGYNRKIVIDNPLSRQAFLDSVRAVHMAKTDLARNLNTLHAKIFFFNLSGEKPQIKVPVFKADFPGMKLKHTFYGINFSEAKNE
jgi:hypothetical protein